MRAPANSRTLVVLLAALTTAALSACSNSNSTAATKYTIGGQLTGLASGRTVTLQDNSTDSLTLSANGSFTFATALAAGASYSVTVSAQPSGQSCSVASGSGTSLANNVTVVSVSCTNNANGLLSLLAGSPYGAGSLDGTGAAASFNYPIGVAADSSGNVYVADTDNNMIREITPAGVVTTLAGSASSSGSADGTGSGASFHRPLGLAVDSSGTVYVADTGNNTIRKVTSAGVVTTLVGTAGAVGSADGTGTAASFNLPTGLAVDGAGNVYVADSMNGAIRKITSAGVVTTLAGTAGVIGSADGTGASASFNYPFGLAVDGAGNVYVADTYNDTIRVVTSAGVVTTLAGTAGVTGSANGTGAAASFRQPFGLAADGAGNLYVADTGNNTIRQITAAGVVTTLAGTAGATGSADGTGAAAGFYEPFGVAVDSAGNAYVADSSNNTIRKITPAAAVSTLAGAVPVSGNADGTGASATFSSANGLAADTAGNLFVADTGNNTIRKVTPAGVVTTLAGVPGSAGSADGAGAQTRFRGPAGIAADSAGNVYVADSGNNTIRKISPDGTVTTLAGTAGLRGNYDGTGAAAIFNGPTGMAVDSAGNVYVADTFNDTVREISPAGAVTTLAGTAGQIGGDDGTGSVARFNNPSGVAVDSSGNLYVADRANDTIRRITSAGVVTTVAGSAGKTGFLPGSAPGVIGSPRGIAVSGNAVSFTFACAIGVLTVQ